MQSGAGPTYGERYVYADAAPATRAQLRVKNVFDPASAVRAGDIVRHFPDDGGAARSTSTAATGRHEDVGGVDERNRYRRLGDSSSPTSNGNCVRKGVNGSGYWSTPTTSTSSW